MAENQGNVRFIRVNGRIVPIKGDKKGVQASQKVRKVEGNKHKSSSPRLALGAASVFATGGGVAALYSAGKDSAKLPMLENSQARHAKKFTRKLQLSAASEVFLGKGMLSNALAKSANKDIKKASLLKAKAFGLETRMLRKGFAGLGLMAAGGIGLFVAGRNKK
jgi:hypothetical protein